MRQPAARMIEAAIGILLEQMEDGTARKQAVVLPVELVVTSHSHRTAGPGRL